MLIMQLFVHLLSLASNSALFLNQDRIIGGIVRINELDFTYAVSVQLDKQHFCGGSIINSRYILTAAHCVFQIDYNKLSVRFGNLTEDGFDVENVYIHEDYNEDEFINDIALIQISGKFTFNKYLNSIQLQTGYNVSGICNVTGWGVIDKNHIVLSEKLRYVEIPIVQRSECERISLVRMCDKCICAGKNGKDACYGDSGGGLVCKNKLTGIVSYGFDCGIAPGVYTEVARYKNWIEAKITSDAFKVETRWHFLTVSLLVIISEVGYHH